MEITQNSFCHIWVELSKTVQKIQNGRFNTVNALAFFTTISAFKLPLKLSLNTQNFHGYVYTDKHG